MRSLTDRVTDRLTPRYDDTSALARARLVLLAVIAAFAPRCRNQPTIARGGQSPAYGHWSCQRMRGHGGAHRAVNYVWRADGQTHYEPVPPDLSSVTRLA